MDMSQYMDMFLEESLENLQTLNENLLKLEKSPEDSETINTIFRVAHTLKGMAGSMGFTNIAELTHKMENVLDKFRSGILKVTSDVLTILFNCLDILENMVDNVKEGSDEVIEIESIINSLDNIEKGNRVVITTDSPKSSNSAVNINATNGAAFDLNVYDINIIDQAHQRNYFVYKIGVNLNKDCLLKSARAFLVYKTLEDIGEIVKTIPSSEDLEQENFDFSFSVMLISMKSSEEVKKLVLNISEISSVYVDEIKQETKPQNADDTIEELVELKNTENVKVLKDDDKTTKKAHQSVRVDLERLDKLMNLVGELVIQRTRLEQLSDGNKVTELHETLEQVGRISSDLQDLVMKVRMLPVERVFNRFPRLVRDLSQELNKEIEFIIKGENTELDRTVIDEIGEPLVHLIRNCADHGIESAEERIKNGKNSKGTIKLTAYQEGNKAVIKVEDDGKGLDVEKIKKKAINSGINVDGMNTNDIKNLVFIQGFSTSDKVTDVSGRGVGMDVVKTKISALGGTIELISEQGKGTSVIIKLPLTLSIIQALLVKVGNECLAISLGFVDKVINIKESDIKYTNNKEVILYRNSVIPVLRLSEKLNLKSAESTAKFVVIVNVGEKAVGLIVDSLLGQQEIVIKQLGEILKNLKEYVGATILGDGLVTLILDVAALV